MLKLWKYIIGFNIPQFTCMSPSYSPVYGFVKNNYLYIIIFLFIIKFSSNNYVVIFKI